MNLKINNNLNNLIMLSTKTITIDSQEFKDLELAFSIAIASNKIDIEQSHNLTDTFNSILNQLIAQ